MFDRIQCSTIFLYLIIRLENTIYLPVLVKIKKSGLSFSLFFPSHFYFLFNLFSSFLFLELRVRVSHMNTRRWKRDKYRTIYITHVGLETHIAVQSRLGGLSTDHRPLVYKVDNPVKELSIMLPNTRLSPNPTLRVLSYNSP